MKPRVFVSSTFFDLKHVRERLERFIENYYLDPVLFESDTVTFEHHKPLDISCYNEVRLCHMMILIVGGRYGSVISGENTTEKKDIYNKEYISITRKEFETATKLKIPVFIFIEKNVYAEYHTYSKNKVVFENGLPENFSFAHVDDINVFKFINTLKNSAIKTFEKIEDIENYLGNQFSGMLYLYLQQLQDKEQEEKILDTVTELKNISNRMNEMLTAVGKNVINDGTFEEIIFKQNQVVLDFFIEQFIDNISFNEDITDERSIQESLELLKITIFNGDVIKRIKEIQNWEEKWMEISKLQNNFKNDLLKIDNRLIIEFKNFYKIFENYSQKILPIIENDRELKDFFLEKLSKEWDLEITGLPF